MKFERLFSDKDLRGPVNSNIFFKKKNGASINTMLTLTYYFKKNQIKFSSKWKTIQS